MATEMMDGRSEGMHSRGRKAEGPRAWVLEPHGTGFDSGSAADHLKLVNISVPQFPPLQNEGKSIQNGSLRGLNCDAWKMHCA